jgi:hypothetical protein
MATKKKTAPVEETVVEEIIVEETPLEEYFEDGSYATDIPEVPVVEEEVDASKLGLPSGAVAERLNTILRRRNLNANIYLAMKKFLNVEDVPKGICNFVEVDFADADEKVWELLLVKLER